MIVADLTKYPNPLRLFTQTRDEWFTELISSFDIPMHIFSAVRDTQLGQLMFAIETVRMKRKRSGEDPGPGLLEGENATMFVPLFSTIKQFQDTIHHDDSDIDTEHLYSTLLPDEMVSQLEQIKKTGQEWFTPLSPERVDEIFVAATEVLDAGVIQPLLDAFGLENQDELREKIAELHEPFAETLFSMYSPRIASAIEAGEFEEETTENQELRVYSVADEEVQLSFNELHGRTNMLYGFLMELKRLVDEGDRYDYAFDMLEPLLSLEMLMMFPTPDTSRIPLVKQHLSRLSQATTTPSSFFDVLSSSYQAFSRIEESNRRVIRKLFSTMEKTMKDITRSFWKQVMAKIKRDKREEMEPLIAIIWSHLRAIQTQAQYREQQSGQDSHSQSHAITVRLEHIFWVQGRSYYNVDQFESPYQFWSAYAVIANKQVRSKEDSLELFYELDELLSSTEILTDEQVQEDLVANHADQYSLIQRLLSYGLEARTAEVYDRVEDYVEILEQLLDVIDEDEMHGNFDLAQEKKVVDDIRAHMKNPLPVDN